MQQHLPQQRDNAVEIVSVRAVDVLLLKETVRELQDRLAKAATESEYKLYEREQEVRRQMEGELNKWKAEAESTASTLVDVK
eukprot:CAMPEP_0202911176 /NCGR_PEP_ID=MMETSP1392-20130828/54265_1 /ASSEMBLY_ACC=CAM_ASM_000868 /TAXON_ID=225041 /ORGANISM="Chlamydomonas chlamydogama, Strain SAG 11-48b" /LENGTH=81 /DNA_ID=CAMNT_0049601577 /DNA_START=1 /DNA_END=243 /DNA_ORIENTATION=+